MQNDMAKIQIKSDEITPFVFFSFFIILFSYLLILFSYLLILLSYLLIFLSYPFPLLYFVLFLKQNSLRMVAAMGESTLAARAKAK